MKQILKQAGGIAFDWGVTCGIALSVLLLLPSSDVFAQSLSNDNSFSDRSAPAIEENDSFSTASGMEPEEAAKLRRKQIKSEFEARINKQPGFSMGGHEQSQGPVLKSQADPAQIQHEAQRCPADAPVKRYDVLAINVDMRLNRWGDHDPQGHMYVLRDRKSAVRQQEASSDGMPKPYGLTLGLGGDPIQPLTIRGNIGDCVRISFENALVQDPDVLGGDVGMPASFHIGGADLVLADSGEPALSTNSDAIAAPGEQIEYEWYIDEDYYNEGTFRIQSRGPKQRYQVSHGLFGAFIVEPKGSRYLDSRTGEELCETGNGGATWCQNSWAAMIDPGNDSSDFREFALMYHEIGNAGFLPRDEEDELNPFIDPLTESYQPNGRAINYRSESFFRRLGEAEVMAKQLELKPDSSFEPGSEQAYNHYEETASVEDTWETIEKGLRGELNDFADESQAYGSYAFGEPPMPIPQSYVGDPIKFRIVHGGSETFHVPHLHGGGIQWQRQPGVGKDPDNPDYTPIDAGLKKEFTNRMPSSGNDAQSIGPSETYDFEVSCGSGGCQLTAGDFLFHCHVASHYVSGMWHFWRVYNTLQDAEHKTDGLPVVAELPDRQGETKAAVNSTELVGETVDFAGQTLDVDRNNVADLVETQLPPQGQARTWQDASVMDWAVEEQADGTPLYKNEPETLHVWPNFQAENPGERRDIQLDPETGKLAFPLLRPHLGKRPPFAPDHGPAPFLEPRGTTRGEPAPLGTNGERSLCPADAPKRTYKLHAIQTPVRVTDEAVDDNGMLFVVKEHEERARNEDAFKVPLAIRANQGDCVDVVLVNELEETGEPAELSKTNIHIHFAQFDTQASDGVIAGASYEQAPRPFPDSGQSTEIAEAVSAGDSSLNLNNAGLFRPGVTIAVGVDRDTKDFETAIVESVDPSSGTVTLEAPLENDHGADEQVTDEYVRYRWYVARQNGGIYFHDHVDALRRWAHGLFGALIAEPEGSQWRHPETGETYPELRSGPIMDILVDQDQEVVPGLEGSFREYALFFADRTRTDAEPPQLDESITDIEDCNQKNCGQRRELTGTINLRAEPLDESTGRTEGPDHLLLDSDTHGDPRTPILESYVGDPMMFRLLTTATEEVHPFHITGHHFRWERFQEDSPPLTTFGVGISERFNAYVEKAGGASEQPGDYLYQNGTNRHFLEGNWGILRVHDERDEDLLALPGNPPSDNGPPEETPGRGPPENTPGKGPPSGTPGRGSPDDTSVAKGACPADAKVRSFKVSAVDQIPLFDDQNIIATGKYDLAGHTYVLDRNLKLNAEGDVERIKEQGSLNPLVIRANAGECVQVTLTNRLEIDPGHVSFHLDMAAVDPKQSLGINLGNNPVQTVAPGETRTYRYFVEEELGAVAIRDFGDPIDHARKGLYGALIVEPQGSRYFDPETGNPTQSGVSAIIETPEEADFREFVTLAHDADPIIGTFNMPYSGEVRQLSLYNYRAEPLAGRVGRKASLDNVPFENENQLQEALDVFSDDPDFGGPPITEVFEAYAGDPVRFRVLSPFSEQPQMFAVEGHIWPLTPGIEGSYEVNSRYLPSTGILNIPLKNGAGGAQNRPGDYWWGNNRLPYLNIGQWGLMRVHEQGADADIVPLPDSANDSRKSDRING